MSPDSAPGSTPVDLIDLSDIMDDGAPSAAPRDSGDMSFDQELEDLFSDALPDDGPKKAPAPEASAAKADDDILELGDVDLADFDLPDAGGASDQAAPDDLIDLSVDSLLEDGEGASLDDAELLELTDLVEDGESQEGEDVLELTELEEIEDDAAPASVDAGEADVSGGDALDLDLSDLIDETPEPAAQEPAEEPDLSDLLAPEPSAQAEAVIPEAAADEELDIPDIDLDLETEAASEPAEPIDLLAETAEPEGPGEPELEIIAEEDVVPAFAEAALDMAPEEEPEAAPAAVAAVAAGAVAGAADGIDLAALDAIIEEAGGPPAEEPQAAVADEEFAAFKERVAVLEERAAAIEERLSNLPGRDALDDLGEKLTEGFKNLLSQGLAELRADLPAAPEAPDMAASLDGVKDELAKHVDARLEEARADREAAEAAIKEAILAEAKALLPDTEALSAQIGETAAAKALEGLPDGEALKAEIARDVKDAVMAEMKAALPDADALVQGAKEAALAELRESLPEPAEPVDADALKREIAALSGRVEEIAAALALRPTKVDLDAAATRVKMGLVEDIERSASAAAVKVLREEIQALLDEAE